MIKKSLWLILCILLLVSLVAGCAKQARDAQDVSGITRFVRSGTRGVTLEFAQGTPKTKLFDDENLFMIAEIRNEGASDLDADDCILDLSGYDDSIILGINKRQLCDELVGKSVLNQQGAFTTADFSSTRIFLPSEVDTYRPNFLLSACYKYKTIASPEVCIDSNVFGVSAGKKACVVRNVGTGSQGAPVSVTNIRAESAGRKEIFEIDVQNVGGGFVFSPFVGLSSCPYPVLKDFKYMDEIAYSVDISGEVLDGCTPKGGRLRLNNGQGKIFCTFDLSNKQAYTTPLKIELVYNYINQISKQVEIVRLPE